MKSIPRARNGQSPIAASLIDIILRNTHTSLRTDTNYMTEQIYRQLFAGRGWGKSTTKKASRFHRIQCLQQC